MNRKLNDPDADETLGGPPMQDGSALDPPEMERTIGPAAAGEGGGDAQLKIGSYTILARLGEGGMGVVYEALQENPRRSVALKIIRGGGFVDEHAVRMFQREAQVLGRLRHPGIAAIYESGRTGDGQYFFAMELVRGVPLDAYLQRDADRPVDKASVRQRVELFLQVCDAVSYAHQRAVIHRDLKPANILVQDASSTASTISGHHRAVEVKVLDFGLARLTEDEMGTVSLATKPGTILGTVPYMSPEQVRGNIEQIDVRSDEYALGVILYEMLAGELPYDLRRAGLPEAARIICEQPPQRLDPELAGRGSIARDLGTIIAKALEKDPARRYQSVAALAEDLQRCLHDQPILAQPPNTIYQLRKLYARHRVGFAFAGVLAVVVVGCAISLGISARRIAIQRDRANREAQVAEQVSGFLVNLFQVSKPEQAQGKTITARELLDKGAGSIQATRAMDPEVKASLLDTMGEAYTSLGLFTESQPLLRAALATRTLLFGARSLQVAQTLRDMGLLALDRGDDQAAQGYYAKSLALYQASEGPSNEDVANLLNDMGTALDHVGQLNQAQSYFQRSLDMRIRLDGANSPKLIPMRTNLAYIAYARKDYAAAEDQFRKELALAVKVYGPDHPNVSKIANNLGGVLFNEKKYAEAVVYYTRALALNRKLLGGQHPEIGLDLANIAEALDAEGDLEGAEQDYRQAWAVLKAKVPATDYRLRFVNTNLGSVLVREGTAADLRDAEGLLRTAVAADQKALPTGSWDIAEAQSELGGCLLAQKRYAAAEPLLVGSFPTLRDKLGANDPATVTRARARIAQVRQALGQPAAR